MFVSRFARLAVLAVLSSLALTAAALAADTATTNSHANLRQGPGTSFQVVVSVPAGTDVTVNACVPNWCAVTTEDDDEGFVAKSLLDFGDAPDAPDQAADICFYQQANFKGPNFCVEAGDESAHIAGNFDDNIESILVEGDISVEVCSEPGFDGDCVTIDHSVKKLPYALRNDISSFSVDGGSSAGDDGADSGDFSVL